MARQPAFTLLAENAQNKDDSLKIKIDYGKKGWELQYGREFLLRLQFRFQFRIQSNSTDPFFFIGGEDSYDDSFNIQRARMKIGGFAYQPYIAYYLEYDFPSAYLLNWQFTFAKNKACQFKLGQWKIKYNSERFISSGKQQLVERSISNRFFTFDRQIGLMLKGDLFEGKAACSSYNVGIFNGNGRMAKNDDGKYLLFARYQWNFSRKVMKMSYSDITRTKLSEGFIALAYARNQSAYTRFSSSGGGQLPGYEDGSKQRYLINQFNVEGMLKYRGFSLSVETHLKHIDDKVNRKESRILGGYVMTGYFLSGILPAVPRPLELTARYAYIQNKTLFGDDIHEISLGGNWFFAEHRNKLTVDFSYIENQDFVIENDNYRFRLQWDVSF